jgi:hypothetical protein
VQVLGRERVIAGADLRLCELLDHLRGLPHRRVGQAAKVGWRSPRRLPARVPILPKPMISTVLP